MRPEARELIKEWKKLVKEQRKKPKGDRMDCGVAARHISKKEGGKGRSETQVLYAKPHHIVCAEKDIKDAKERYNNGYPDRIEKSAIEGDDRYFIYIHRGNGAIDLENDPGSYYEQVLDRRIELKPGMLLYSSESFSDAREGKEKWMRYYKCTEDYSRWSRHHMVMYVGNGKVMDLWLNKNADPKQWKDVYAGTPKFFVTLSVLDPFQSREFGEIILNGNTLKEGSTKSKVRHLNKALIKLGYLSKEIDGVFDNATKEALKAFQEDENLKADGVYGACTATVMIRALLAKESVLAE